MCDESPLDRPAEVTDATPVSTHPRRRGFLRLMGGAVIALVTFPTRWARAKKFGLSVSKIAELQKVGGSKVLMVKDTKVLVIRDSETTVKAINPTCTHKKCEVKYKADANNLFCKCHKSAFQLDGTVTAGPAPRPLQVYDAALNADQIVITLPD